MSENLKRLRREWTGTPMAELKKLKFGTNAYMAQKRIEMWKDQLDKKAVEHERKAFAPYRTLAGMSQIEDLECKIEEANKEEQRVNEELKKTIQSLITNLHRIADDEESDYYKYMDLAKNYSALPTAYDVFKRIAFDEQQHAKYINDLIYRLECEIKGELPYWKKK